MAVLHGSMAISLYSWREFSHFAGTEIRLFVVSFTAWWEDRCHIYMVLVARANKQLA